MLKTLCQLLKKTKPLIWKDRQTSGFVAALFITGKTWKQPSADEWKKKMGHIYTIEYHEWVKSLRRVQLFATPWTVAHQAPWSMGFSQARILEWVSDFLFQGIFATQGRNTSLLLDRQIPYPLAIQWKLILSSYMKSSRRPSGPREAVCPFAYDVDSLGWAPAIAAPCHVMSCALVCQ